MAKLIIIDRDALEAARAQWEETLGEDVQLAAELKRLEQFTAEVIDRRNAEHAAIGNASPAPDPGEKEHGR